MSKLFAPAPDPDALITRRARRRPEGLLAAWKPEAWDEPRNEPKPNPADSVSMDADMLDFVKKFEESYAGLAPASEEPRPQRGAFGDDLFPEFPEPFDVEPARTRTTHSPPAPRREPELLRSPKTIAAVTAQLDRRLEDDGDVDIDEAFSILRAAEGKGASAAQRAASGSAARIDEQKPPALDSAFEKRREPRAEPIAREPAAEPSPAGMDWTTKSRRPHSMAVAGGVVALIVGIGVGYVVGRGPNYAASGGRIDASQQVSPQLRLDYDLRKR
jgi:hypothetical protein